MKLFFTTILTVLLLQTQTFALDIYSVSRSDMNRIICDADVESVFFSEEKGLSISTSGKDVYVKFPVKITIDQDTNEETKSYSNTPSELYIVCGGTTHSIMLNPKNMTAKTIELVSYEHQKELKGKDEEEVISALMKALIEDSVPQSFKIDTYIKEHSWRFKTVETKRYEGNGYILKEFHIYSPKTATIITSELGSIPGVNNPIAAMVTSEKFNGWVRAFVIERGNK